MTLPDGNPRERRRWMLGAALLTAGLVVGLTWCLQRSPLTLYDGVGPILDAHQAEGARQTFQRALNAPGYLRPLRLAQIKAAYDLVPDHPTAVFRAIHAGLIVWFFAAVVAFLRPSSASELVATGIALMLYLGHHAFFMVYAEVYPINHFLEIAALALTTAALARGRPSPAKDIAVTMFAVIGVLTLESGLLIPAVVVASWVLGWRGVSWRGCAAALAVIVGYFWLRFGILHIASPALAERSAGWWLLRLEPEELIARFEHNRLPFYAYNVMASIGDLLLSQPKNGTFGMVTRWIDGNVTPWMIIQLIASALATGIWFAACAGALRRWRHGTLSDRDRIVLLALAIVLANAAMNFAYVKSEVLSVGAAFYAAGLFAACANLLDRARPAWRHWLVSTLVAVLSVTWTVRAAGTFFSLRAFAYKTASDWGRYSLEREDPASWRNPAVRQLFEDIRDVNVGYDVPSPTLTNERDIDDYVEIQ